MTFAHLISAERKRAGLTIPEFAEALGISERLLNYWESGEHEPKEIPAAAYLSAARQLNAPVVESNV